MHGKFRDRLDDMANSRGQTARHVIAGLALTAAAVAISAAIARRNAPTDDNPEIQAAYDGLKRPAFQPPKAVFGIVWPPLFMALTLSGLRLWNAPTSPARTRALSLWTAIQGLNALWMALGPRRLGGQLTTAVATLGTAVAYALEARRIDAPAAGLAAPYLGWVGLANILTEELWRKNRRGAKTA
ncbi:MAG: TspO/MBR family protein [Caulobacteraceae bacterium]